MTAIRFWKPMNVSGSPASSSENWSARCSTPRESWLEMTVIAGAISPTASTTAGTAAAVPSDRVRREPLPQPGGGEHPERRHDQQVEQPVRHVAVVDVAELVRDDEPHLAGRELLEQVVVDHDALGAADAGDVGVGRRRAPGGVHHVDLADVDARLAGQREHGRARRAVGQRGELVEQRVEHDRREVRRGDAEGDHHGGRRRPPAAPEAAHARRSAARRPRPPARRRSPCSWRRLRRSRPSPGSPGRHPSRARGRSPARAAWPPRAPRRAPRRPPPRPGPGAGAAAAARAAGAPRRARAGPARSRCGRPAATAGRSGSPPPSRSAPR